MKSKVVDELKTSGMSALEAGRTFDTVFDATKRVIARDGEVRVPGFGTFKMKHRGARSARNPRTGEPIRVAERDVLTFKESKTGR